MSAATSTVPSDAIKLFGTDEPPAETRLLTAGPLSAELDGGNLRYVRFGGAEAIRAISYVSRDQFWGTYNPALSDFVVDQRPDSFTVTYTAVCEGEGQRLTYRATITGAANGDLTFAATGVGDTDFLTNRTGFVVLHGVDGIAGEPCLVEHVDGSIEETVFPILIDPKQPIMDIRSLTHSVCPGLDVRCVMDGDTFEMEDQRNWTDASYKTYVRPLDLPHPYKLPAGEPFEQSVSLSFEGAAPATAAASTAVQISVGDTVGKMPEVGMWVELQHVAAALDNGATLAGLKPAFLNCFVDARGDVTQSDLQGCRDLGRLLDAPLSLEAVISGKDPQSEMAALADLARNAGVDFRDVAASLSDDLGFVMPGSVFPDTAEFDALFAACRAAFPSARVGGGNFVYFTELNRKPVPTDQLDFLVHGTSALIHAADDRSVTETIECLPYVFRSARAQYPDLNYRISPAGIGSRTSPFGNEPTPNPDASRVTMSRADPRQRGLLGAAWHLGYAARAAEGGVDSLALGAPVGEFGLVASPQSYGQPWYDGTSKRFPAYHVMQALYAASGRTINRVTSSAARDVIGVCLETTDGPELWLGNLSGEELAVHVAGFSWSHIGVLDTENFDALAAPDGAFRTAPCDRASVLNLPPYAVARLQA